MKKIKQPGDGDTYYPKPKQNQNTHTKMTKTIIISWISHQKQFKPEKIGRTFLMWWLEKGWPINLEIHIQRKYF